MDELVFLEPNYLKGIPFTTSELIAIRGEVEHDTVKRLIRKYESDLEEFGKVGFDMRALESGQSEKIYKLNEEQIRNYINSQKEK